MKRDADFPSFSLLCYWFDDVEGLIRVEKEGDSVTLISSPLEKEVTRREVPRRPLRREGLPRGRPRRNRRRERSPRRRRGRRPGVRLTRSPSVDRYGDRYGDRCAGFAECFLNSTRTWQHESFCSIVAAAAAERPLTFRTLQATFNTLQHSTCCARYGSNNVVDLSCTSCESVWASEYRTVRPGQTGLS